MQHGSVSRGVWRFLLLIILLGGGTIPAYAQLPAASIRITADLAMRQPSQKVKFQLTAASDSAIDQVTLIYGITGHGCTGDGTRRTMPITEGTQVQVSWLMDDDFTPGSELWWQWQIHNNAGTTLLTEVKRQILLDDRFLWRNKEEGQITLYWYSGSDVFAQHLMDTAQSALARLANQAGVTTENNMRIFVYGSSEQMRAVMPTIAEWAGGVAISENDLILVGISPFDTTQWPKEVIPHEIAHLITENGFVNCQAVRLPLWLLEGIAKYAEGPVVWEYRNLIRQALSSASLPPLTTLRYSFPMDAAAARLAYAHSAMLVNYLIETFGVEKMNALVDAIRSGQSIDQALRPIYGWDTNEVDQAWRASLGYGHAPTPDFATFTPASSLTSIPTLNLQPVVGTPNLFETPSPSALSSSTLTFTPIPSPTSTRIIAKVAPTRPTPDMTSPRAILQTLIAMLIGSLGMLAVIGGVIVWVLHQKK